MNTASQDTDAIEHLWSKQDVLRFHRELKAEYGANWHTLLTDRVRAALVSERALDIATLASMTHPVTAKETSHLRNAMLVAAGLK
jgi:hypothetical protein